MTHHHRATARHRRGPVAATAVDRYPVVRTCVLVVLLATAIALAFRPGTAMVIVAATVFACVLLGAATRSLRRAAHRVDTILAGELDTPARANESRPVPADRQLWRKTA